MRSRLFSFMLAVLLSAEVFGQSVKRMDPYDVQYEPGVVLVKFEEDVDVPLGKDGRLGKAAPSDVHAVFSKYGIQQGERLFPEAQRGQQLQNVRTFGGEEHRAGSLYNIMRFRFDSKNDAKIVADEMSKQKGVIYAEPDYIFSALETIPNDALYGQQWYLPVIHAPEAWDVTTGDSTQLIAIIDTGVDWDHPDLDDKIKINWTEYNGATGVDDDGNGYVDDIRGWDFINNDNNPNDDNSHGTHVAGIAAAETNNGTGCAGVSWGSKILPVKVLQSTGYGSSSTVAQGVNYARFRGAKVINMSLGSYTESLTLKTTLENAYSTAVLVAAAGNDGLPIEGIFGKPLFPACYGWVIGVMTSDQSGLRALFSNYDPSGPISDNNEENFNYELSAPGVFIHSTLPNGQYGNLSGTSMSAPVVSGSIAMQRTHNSTISNELVLGNLINGLSSTLNILSSMLQTPEPKLQYNNYAIVDTLAGCDRDGRIDAGETVQLWLTVQNVWGQADSVWTRIRLHPLEELGNVNVLDSLGHVGGIAPYANSTNASDPFSISFNASLNHARDIVFQIEFGCKNSGLIITKDIHITIENGVNVTGVINENTTWTSNKKYLINGSFRIGTVATLRIMPGTQIYVSPDMNIDLRGRLIAKGKSDSLIIFESNPEDLGSGIHRTASCAIAGVDTFQYCYFKNIGNPLLGNIGDGAKFYVDHCIFDNLKNTIDPSVLCGIKYFYNNIIRNFSVPNIFSVTDNYAIEYNNFYNLTATNVQESYIPDNFRHNNFVNIESKPPVYYDKKGVFEIPIDKLTANPNNFTGCHWVIGTFTNRDVVSFPNQYWGTTNNDTIANNIWDFWDNSSLPQLNYLPFKSKPDSLAHGLVWKILLNGDDLQGVSLDPIGEETIRFDVYFNKAMDIEYSPNLTFGVRDPFTQHLVEDNINWSADSTIWTGYYTVGLETGDGINTIRVEGAKDTDHFEIPIENRRFHFNIDAAGSLANEFIATVGVGKVELEWPKAPTDDLLGYNMYRFYNVTDTTFSDTTRINTVLLTDSSYTDFAVIPDTTYHYMYKVVGTDMAESDFSKVATATPVNASSGDANGDLAVNVQDIVAIVNYILEENPEPFLLEAADVNDDGAVNVLDIVGVVNIILGLPKPMIAQHTADPATLAIKEGAIIMTSPAPVYAIQFTMTGNELEKCFLKPTDTLTGFEIGKNETTNRIKVIVYTLKGMTLSAGRNVLFDIEGGKGLTLSDVTFVDRNGAVIPTGVEENVPVAHQFELFPSYPNPFNPETRIRYGLPKASKVVITIYNVLGQRVRVFEEGMKPAGFHEVSWDGKGGTGLLAGSGIYLCRFEADEFRSVKKMSLVR